MWPGRCGIVVAIKMLIVDLLRRLFPLLVGDSGLDSCRAFTVHYDAEVRLQLMIVLVTFFDLLTQAQDGDKERGTHFDNSEVLV